MKYAIVLGANADIGTFVVEKLLMSGYSVVGSYRNSKPKIKAKITNSKIHLIKCDVTNSNDLNALENFLNENKISWELFFSSIGTTEPIGRFFELNFSEWKNCFDINFTSQMDVLHRIYKFRTKNNYSNVIFMAGGGTNNPFTNYSAYTVSKIGLIKMCELLDDEYKNIKFSILGPGFVKTKTHKETIAAGEKAGANFERVKKFLESDQEGTSMEKIFDVIHWIVEQPREIISGRNFSVVNDEFNNADLIHELSINPNMYKLRRYRNNWKSDTKNNNE